MRRALVWVLPIGAALIAAIIFGAGFYSFARGDTGEPVAAAPSHVSASARAPRGEIVPLVIGDSLARGTGDESGLGIGGRLVDYLKASHPVVRPAVNIAVNGARTKDVEEQLKGHNVQTLIAQSNVIIVSIGGNDLWGDNNWSNAPPRDPEAVMKDVLNRVEESVRIPARRWCRRIWGR